MKQPLMRFGLVSAAFFLCTGYIVDGGDIGTPAKGGQPEYLFIDKVKKSEAASTAEMIGRALAKGRLIIFAHMERIGDPNIGDKGFTADYFAERWLAALEADFLDATPSQKRILDKLVFAGKQSIANNQERLNVKGVSWKNFLPAKWARETGQILNSMTGIVTNQPARHYRHPANAPDAAELRVLKAFTNKNYNDGKPVGEWATMGKQKIYRYFEPVPLMAPCLACHGKPKGEIDKIGFEKDGLDAGDIIGLISVSVPYED